MMKSEVFHELVWIFPDQRRGTCKRSYDKVLKRHVGLSLTQLLGAVRRPNDAGLVLPMWSSICQQLNFFWKRGLQMWKKNGRYEKRRKTCFEFFLVIAEGSKRWGFKEWKLYSLSSLPMMRNRRIEKGAFLSPKWRWSRIKTFVRRLLKESYDHKEIDLLSVLKIVLLCFTKSSLEL